MDGRVGSMTRYKGRNRTDSRTKETTGKESVDVTLVFADLFVQTYPTVDTLVTMIGPTTEQAKERIVTAVARVPELGLQIDDTTLTIFHFLYTGNQVVAVLEGMVNDQG
ncbi:UNVERIFIED_CONTAM: hypothetical protein PYX00_005762 [Menopon gallinae]|uniref:Uncharacterized protein n=1 Tax=Menopon gallinae TaxID=328185 RepID=A0AAW2HSL4_9NEOP